MNKSEEKKDIQQSDENRNTEDTTSYEDDSDKEYDEEYYRDIFDFFDWNNSNTIPTSVSHPNIFKHAKYHLHGLLHLLCSN